MDRVTSTAAVGTEAQRRGGDDGKADGIRRGILAGMGDPEAVQTQQLGPEVQLLILGHDRAPRRDGATALRSSFYKSAQASTTISKGGGEPKKVA
jgi:hypothetical protein